MKLEIFGAPGHLQHYASDRHMFVFKFGHGGCVFFNMTLFDYFASGRWAKYIAVSLSVCLFVYPLAYLKKPHVQNS